MASLKSKHEKESFGLNVNELIDEKERERDSKSNMIMIQAN